MLLLFSLDYASTRAVKAAAAIPLILDNFGSHPRTAVQAARASWAGRIPVHFLPPYCPTENRIDRLLVAVDAYLTAHNHAVRQRPPPPDPAGDPQSR